MGQMGLDESTFTILPEGDRLVRSKTISKVGLETKSLGRSTSSAEEPVGKKACSDLFNYGMVMNNLLVGVIAFHFFAGCLFAQNPPLTGDPYTPRGRARSPDGRYEWRIRTVPTIRYELIHIATGN